MAGSGLAVLGRVGCSWVGLEERNLPDKALSDVGPFFIVEFIFKLGYSV